MDQAIPPDAAYQRLRRTYISGSPSYESRWIAFLMVLICYAFSVYFWSVDQQQASALLAIPEKVFKSNEWWRLFTALFIHADLQHFLSNAIMLFILGYLVSGYFGLGLYPLWAILLSAVTNFFSLLSYPENAALLGASGMVYVLAGLWISLYFFIQRNLSVPQRLFRVAGVVLIVFFPTQFEPNVSYRTHGFGLFVGIVFGVIYFLIHRGEFRSAEVYEWVVDEEIEENLENPSSEASD
jgi:rhomboid protease GluP